MLTWAHVRHGRTRTAVRALALGLVLAAGSAPAAYRPRPVITGTAICDPGSKEKVIEWKVRHTERDRAAKVIGTLGNPDTPLKTSTGEVVARIPAGIDAGAQPALRPRGRAGDMLRLEQRVPGETVGGVTLTVQVQWSKKERGEGRGSERKTINLGKSPCGQGPPQREPRVRRPER